MWLQAEMECERLIYANPTGYPDPSPHDFDWIRMLAWENPAGATVLAQLMREHRSDYARGLLLAVIGDPNAKWLHTPEVRQILWEVRDFSFAYTTVSNALDSFGPDQLRPLSDIEFLRQLDVVTIDRTKVVSDELFELYLREAIKRKSPTVIAILEDNRQFDPSRDYLIRLARNRCLGLADPLTFKVAASADDPTLYLIDLALTDPDLQSFDLQAPRTAQCYVDVSMQATPGASFKPYVKKWPPSQTLKRGEPYHTAVYLGFVRRGKVRVSLQLFTDAPPPPSPLLPGPRLMPPMYVDVDLSAAK